MIINGVYWAPVNPRLLTNADGYSLLKINKRPDKYGGCPELPHRLLALCDISADLGVCSSSWSCWFMKKENLVSFLISIEQVGVAVDL